MNDKRNDSAGQLDAGPEVTRFRWTKFYRAIAEKLLAHRQDRKALIQGINKVAADEKLSYLEDVFPDGTRAPMKDICPFTTIGVFNRQMTDRNRTRIAEKIGKLLGVDEPAPSSFEAIPTLNNLLNLVQDVQYTITQDNVTKRSG